MKPIVIFIVTALLLCPRLCAQIRIIQGRVISQNLDPLAEVCIQNKDTVLYGKTDLNGRFKIEIQQQTQSIFLTGVGLEQTHIKLKNDCDILEIIMIYNGTYDFMSPKKVDRLRLRQFNNLPKLHLQAYDKGLFSRSITCFSYVFEPVKPYFNELKRQRTEKEAELKKIFGTVKIGDTIRIPFKEQARNNGTDSATLFSYSAFTDYTKYDCIIKGVVIGKNKKHKGYNLRYRVLNCDNCKPSNMYRGGIMKAEELFELDMRNRKVLID